MADEFDTSDRYRYAMLPSLKQRWSADLLKYAKEETVLARFFPATTLPPRTRWQRFRARLREAWRRIQYVAYYLRHGYSEHD